MSPDDIDAARRCDAFCAVLALIARPLKCERCDGVGVLPAPKVSGGMASYYSSRDNHPCPDCDNTGCMPVPSLVETCLVWSDQLEEWGDSRAEMVRPSHTGSWLSLPGDGGPATDTPVKRLLLLFREPCERCKGKGRTEVSGRTGPERRDSIEHDCPECHARGWLDVPMPVLTHGERVVVPKKVAVCKREGCGGPLYFNTKWWKGGIPLSCSPAGGADSFFSVDCIKNTPENGHSGCVSEAYVSWSGVRDRVWQWASKCVRKIS